MARAIPRHYRTAAAVLGTTVALIAPAAVFGAMMKPPTGVLGWGAFGFGVLFSLGFGGWLIFVAVTGRLPRWLHSGIDDYV